MPETKKEPIHCAECEEATPVRFQRTSTEGEIVCAWCDWTNRQGGYMVVEAKKPHHICITCGGPKVPGVGCPCKIVTEYSEDFAEAELALAEED